jgi:hypothetical protein
VNPVVDAPVARLPDFIKGSQRTECGFLRTKVGTANHHDINHIAGEIAEADLAKETL